MTRRAKQRWYRLYLPLAMVLAIIAGTVIVRWLSEPSSSDPQYLSPTTPGLTSGDRLAELLRAKGISLKREIRSSDALTAVWAESGDATLFIPAPEYVHGDYLWMLRHSPAGTRVVLVEPGETELRNALPPVGLADRRWATAATLPGRDCTLTDAGRAGVTRSRYGVFTDQPEVGTYCYEQGLVAVTFGGVEFVVAGSPEPFRADRISEHDNAELAVDLLSARPTLIWLDLHANDPKPKSAGEELPGSGRPIPSLAPGDERERGGSPRPTPSRSRSPGQAEAEAPAPPDPFPDWLLPAVVMIIITALALAIARGRRLGAPVSEPLPIEVRGAETAIGRGNLYRRARAREAALETLRVDARRRLAVALGLPVAGESDALLDALATRTGQERQRLADVLFGPAPELDDELQARSSELLRLVEQVNRGPAPRSPEGEAQ